MENTKMRIDILPNLFLKKDGTFDLEEALILSGKYAGICYDKEGFNHIDKEPIEKTMRRVEMTKNNGHHSVYGHISISFNMQNIPKILAMIINNEKEYNTSEKSLRYTPLVKTEGSIVTDKEIELYNKWIEIFSDRIKDKYGKQFNDSKIKKLAQENARYLVTVFMPTQMVYTTSLRQINYIASWFKDYIKNTNNGFDSKIALYMKDFVSELERLNILDEGLMRNEKHREISLFGDNLSDRQIYFGEVYSTLYKGSFAQMAQAQRHRTVNYQIERLRDKEYYVPEIIDYSYLKDAWLKDIESVSEVVPQGEMVLIHEMGTYDNFIKKCKERLCSSAQLEIMRQTKETLEQYRLNLIANHNSRLYKDICKYSYGAKCTFPDYECTEQCGFKEGINLTRKI